MLENGSVEEVQERHDSGPEPRAGGEAESIPRPSKVNAAPSRDDDDLYDRMPCTD